MNSYIRRDFKTVELAERFGTLLYLYDLEVVEE